MLRLLADDTWNGLEPYLRQADHKRAAIAYISRAGADLLDLSAGDLIIVDDSDTSLRNGLVDPAVVTGWIRERVEVRSLPALHAKVLHLRAKRTTHVVVGSANASALSVDLLREASVVSDDKSLCSQVDEQLLVWKAESEQIDEAWLTQAREIYQPPPPAVPVKRRSRQRRLWAGMAVDE